MPPVVRTSFPVKRVKKGYLELTGSITLSKLTRRLSTELHVSLLCTSLFNPLKIDVDGTTRTHGIYHTLSVPARGLSTTTRKVIVHILVFSPRNWR